MTGSFCYNKTSWVDVPRCPRGGFEPQSCAARHCRVISYMFIYCLLKEKKHRRCCIHRMIICIYITAWVVWSNTCFVWNIAESWRLPVWQCSWPVCCMMMIKHVGGLLQPCKRWKNVAWNAGMLKFSSTLSSIESSNHATVDVMFNASMAWRQVLTLFSSLTRKGWFFCWKWMKWQIGDSERVYRRFLVANPNRIGCSLDPFLLVDPNWGSSSCAAGVNDWPICCHSVMQPFCIKLYSLES